MRKFIKWIGIVLGVLIVLILIVGAVGYLRGTSIVTKTYDVHPESVNISSDPEIIARGEHMVDVFYFCKDCHGENFGGQEFINDPAFAVVYTPNLTSGRGGISDSYQDMDWDRAIRHGVRPDRTNLLIMPSHFYNRIGDRDFEALVSYMKNLPPVDNEAPTRQIGPAARLFVGLGLAPAAELLPAEGIDQGAPHPTAPEPGESVEYGNYLALTCRVCHGEDLSGGIPPGEEGEDVEPAPNLTPGGELANWTEEDFITALRTGQTPEGHQLDPEAMPWEVFSNATDEELRAIWMYLRSLPPLEGIEHEG